AILIIDASDRRIVDANPVVIHLVGSTAGELIGQRFPDDIDSKDRELVVDLFSSIRNAGQATRESAQIRLKDQQLRISASLFRQGNHAHFLVRLSPLHDLEREVPALSKTRSRLLEIIDLMPEGFVVTDMKGQIITANPAFLDLAQLATEEQAQGESLGRWLGRSDIDMNVLTANLKEHGVVRLFVTTIEGDLGSREEVELSAVSVPDADEPCLGFAIRGVGSRQRRNDTSAGQLPRSVEQLTELVGHVSLKDLVRETTDMIERMSIEAALELTSDNRASAAELLGLSRQSLYAKLHRYGLGDLPSNPPDDNRG
ncbi:MAG TPA: transcriptional regulator PpsR, partial [Kiloniellaceae bacterium]|nr:transcriptional regulator PpsR [Kiloniellaceae bacterium]